MKDFFMDCLVSLLISLSAISVMMIFFAGFNAAHAESMESAVAAVSTSHHSEVRVVNGSQMNVVYVRKAGLCDSISVMRSPQNISNYRVCNGVVISQNSVSPSWDSEGGKPTFMAVVGNAMTYGSSSQRDQNGYLISAKKLRSNNDDCNQVEVIISYEDDLVQREIISSCVR